MPQAVRFVLLMLSITGTFRIAYGPEDKFAMSAVCITNCIMIWPDKRY